MTQDAFDQLQISRSLTSVTSCLERVIASPTMLREIDHRCAVQSQIQSLFGLKFNNIVEQNIYEVILSHALDAERMSPMGFIRCSQCVLRYLKGLPNNLDAVTPEGSRWAGNHACRRTDIDDVIASSLSPKFVEIVNEAIKLGGFRAAIIVEPTLAPEHSLELIKGHTFDLQPAFEIKKKKIDNLRCLCIDGYVETVSEIHGLLMLASETREYVIVFLRGLADDVRHTLKINHDRGTLNIIPIIVDFDLLGLNTLNDLAIITGGTLVSSNKGDTINMIKLHEAPCIDRILVQDRRIVIGNASTKQGVKRHLEALRQRRSKENVNDIARLLDHRIRTLSSNHVILRLPRDREFVMTSQMIDYVLRNIRCMIDHGVRYTNAHSEPALVAVASRLYASRCVKTLLSMGCVITPVI